MMTLHFLYRLGLASVISITAASSFAKPDFLPPDQAFQFSAELVSTQSAQLKWKIAPHYYLYHDQFKVTVNQQPIKLHLPAGKPKDDPTFGVTNVHYNQVITNIAVQPNTKYQVVWQGCSEDGLCYPLQRRSIQTNAEGLLPQADGNSASQKNLFKVTPANNNDIANDATAATTAKAATTSLTSKEVSSKPAADSAQKDLAPATQTLATEKKLDSAPTQNIDTQTSASSTENISISAASPSDLTAATSAVAENSSVAATDSQQSQLQLNNDQGFFQLLSPDTLFLNLIIFFLLGILLAFLPCSLPLIPILSGIIVQRASGYKAIAVALSFVISMALVYSLMGIVVAEIGYSFQRWFQSPVVIGLFALVFVALALNLFGLYQLSLPQSVMQALDRFQNKQKGGTLVGAMVMGALSALIVGPCMSAPLAGALLFVSQSQNAVLGGLYLFILGLGIGLPLFIASVFGAKYLPKPGLWMDRIKIGFGFVMLMVAVYFIRPMIAESLYAVLLALLCLALALYLIRIRRESRGKIAGFSLILLAALSLSAALWNIQHGYQAYQVKHATTAQLTWQKVTTAAELEQALTLAKQQQRPILLDVYADWCVACQPIEKEVMPRADVQAALAGFSLIKLDLTHYDESQDLILKDREILGPPTMLFLNADGQEQRHLRLTGTFSAPQFIQQLQQLGQ